MVYNADVQKDVAEWSRDKNSYNAMLQVLTTLERTNAE